MNIINGSPMGIRSPFSPRIRQKLTKTPSLAQKKSSRYSISGKSIQGAQTIIKSSLFNVEKFGNTLPVIITEALTFSERNTVVSVRISDCGYAWLVCGRRLLVWQFHQGSLKLNTSYSMPRKATSGATQYFELMLPQSDLAHKADLVSVFTCSGSHIPSCIAVSPEGVIRYWPNIAHEGVSIEVTADLQGQECDSLCTIGSLGCILATTTCTVVLVQPQVMTGGQHSLQCHMLRIPTGWLGGISKKMSSLIFGPMSSEHSGETRLVRVLNVKQSDVDWWVLVLAGHSLQKWSLRNNEPEQLLYIVELGRIIRDAYQCTAWEACGSNPADIDLWLLDIQAIDNSVMILAAAVNLHVSPQVQYALVRFDTESKESLMQIEEFFLLKLYGLYQEDDTADFLSYRIILCDSRIYIYRHRDITIIQPALEPEVLDFMNIGDRLLGGSVCSNIPVFFSKNHGLVAIYSNDDMSSDQNQSLMDMSEMHVPDSKFFDVSMHGNTLYLLEPEEMLSAHKDVEGQLKSAFIFHIKNQQQTCQEIIHTLFSKDAESKNQINSVLDKTVIAISKGLLDDVPANDPRWLSENGPSIGLGSSSSIQIQHQLQDKQQAHNMYIGFLQECNLWERLSAVTVNNKTVATRYILADHSEFLVAMIALRNLSSSHCQLIQDMIEYVVKELYDEPLQHLTKTDVFYREVSKVGQGMWALVKKCEEVVHSGVDPTKQISLISETNSVMLNVLDLVMRFRQQKAAFFALTESTDALQLEYVPWTFDMSNYGFYNSINNQQILTLKYGARVASEGNVKACLYDQYVSLIDLMIDAWKCNYESIKSARKDQALRQYQTERHKLIMPLVDDKEWERAASVAEKYLDFTALINICDSTNNQTRLNEYLNRFKDNNFAQELFNWYMQENKQAKLLEHCRSTRFTSSSSLTKYLGTYPSLSWLQHVFEGNYEKVAQTLKSLADAEKDSITRKKSMLSIAKLSSLVASGINTKTDFVCNVNNCLEQILYQEELPDSVLSAFGYDTLNQPVLNASELAQLYVCEEYTDITEYEYKKALELLTFINNKDQKDELLLQIWCSAILKDNWGYQEVSSPMEVIQETVFFKVVDLALAMGSKIDDILPPIDMLLTSPKLGSLTDNTNFQYLMKVGYNYFYRSQNYNDDI